MFCKNCGAKIEAGGQFCPNCGQSINSVNQNFLAVPTNKKVRGQVQGYNQQQGSAGVMVGRVIGGDMQNVILGFSDGKSATVARNCIGFPVANGDMLDIYLYSDGTERYAPHDDMPRAAKNRVNKIVYILLAILLGDIGAHKFYCGKIGMGILYLAFCWTMIPGIAGLIEGILAIGKPTDAQGNMEIP